MKSLACAIASLLLLASVADAIQGTLSLPTSVKGNVQTDITFYTGGPELLITASNDCQVTVNLVVSGIATAPTGYNFLSNGASLGVGIGIQLVVSPSSTTITGNLTGGTLATAALNILAQANIQAGCLQYDSTTQTYNRIAIAVPSGSNQITVPISSVGTFVFVGFNIDSPIPTFYNYARDVQAGVRSRVGYYANQAEQLVVELTASANTQLTVNYSASTSRPNPDGYIAVNAYFNIETTSATNVVANLSYAFDQAAIAAAGIAEDTLRFAYYTGSEWKFDGNAQISGNIVSQATTHFSEWGVYGTSSASTLCISALIAILAIVM